jgi:hypothetical protein
MEFAAPKWGNRLTYSGLMTPAAHRLRRQEFYYAQQDMGRSQASNRQRIPLLVAQHVHEGTQTVNQNGSFKTNLLPFPSGFKMRQLINPSVS